MTVLPRVLSITLLALLVACGGLSNNVRGPKEQALYDYTSALRWSEFETALTHVDPFVREENPLTPLDLERYKQLQVTGYEVKKTVTLPDGSFERTVEIRVINKHTQIERVVTAQESWRFDAAAKRWWLVSGLPDLSPQ